LNSFGKILALATLSVASAALSGCGSEQATAQNDPIAPAPSPAVVATPAAPTTAISAKVELVAGPTIAVPPTTTRAVDRTFDDIKFDLAPGAPFRRELLTAEIESLAGQRVRIRGYILPTSQSRGIKQFVLVRDNQECCFGPGAALYDCVLVEMQPGRTAEFSIRPVAVEGTFRIELLNGPDDVPLAIYRMEGEVVEK
jgi:hypothetical protein